MKGHIRQRGAKSWELKFDAGHDPATGKRNIQYVSVRGTKREAQVKLAELIAAVGKNEYIEPSKVTVAEHVRARVEAWSTAAEPISPKTAERYRQIIEAQIVTHIGNLPLQKLKPFDLERWHATLLTSGRGDGKGGVGPRTIGHAHRILGKALREAEKNGMLARNVAKLQTAPKVEGEESVILTADQVQIVLNGLRGRSLYPMVVTALFTGVRRGELLALRWRAVDLDGGKLKVVESLEQLQDGSLRFKLPKTKAGRREITLPDIVIEALRNHRRQQLETRVALGMGKLPDDALVFPTIDGGPRSPRAVSKEWARVADDLGVGDVTLHGLRHSHASQLIDAGVDIVTISKRLGHASPAVTMTVYAHLFQNSDAKAAEAINKALAGGTPA